MDAKDKQEVSDMLAPLTAQIVTIQTTLSNLPPSAGDALIENRRTRFSDAGGWAIHFSIVRMTVSTFLITAAWGLVSVKWDEYSRPLALAALCIWGLAGFFLFIFTKATYDRSAKQKEWQTELPTCRQGKPHSTQTTLSAKTWRSIWMPFWTYLAVSILYLCLLDAWAQHGGDPYVTWPALLKSEIRSAKQKPMDQLIHSVDEINASMKNLATSLTTIEATIKATGDGGFSRPIVTPTPTLTRRQP